MLSITTSGMIDGGHPPATMTSSTGERALAGEIVTSSSAAMESAYLIQERGMTSTSSASGLRDWIEAVLWNGRWVDLPVSREIF